MSTAARTTAGSRDSASRSRQFLKRITGNSASRVGEALEAIKRTGLRALLALVIFGGLALWTQNALDRSIKDSLRSQLEVQRDSTEAAVTQWATTLILQLTEAASRIESATPAHKASTLARLLESSDAVAYLITDSAGQIVESSKGIPTGRPLPFPVDELQKWLALPKARLWPPRHFATSAGLEPLLAVSAPLSPHGALHLLLDPRGRFSEIMMIARPGETGETYAFDADGHMISRSRFLEQLKQIGLLRTEHTTSILNLDLRDPGVDLSEGGQTMLPRSQLPLLFSVRSALSKGKGSNVDGYSGYRGVPVVGAWDYLPEYGIGLVSAVNVSEAFQLRSALRTVLAVLLIALCFTVVFSLWTGHRNLQLRNRSAHAERRAERLGQYTLGKKLGEGGMGAVYEARHAMLRRPTAVKLIKPPENGTISEMAFARFEREVQLTAELTHPNTIAIFDFGKTPDGVFYYAMEYLDGVDLDELVTRSGPLSNERAAYLIAEACGSLAEAHERGLIHRDIKPSNLMVCERGGEHDRVKVLDFGLVKDLESERRDASVTAEGAITGTPHYMAPECVMGSEAATAKSDIYALGAVLYFLLSGRDLFPDRDGMAVMIAHLSEAPPPLTQVAPQVSAELALLVHECLDKDPKKRPTDARSVARRLRAISNGKWDHDQAKQWWQTHPGVRSRLSSDKIPMEKSLVDSAAETILSDQPLAQKPV